MPSGSIVTEQRLEDGIPPEILRLAKTENVSVKELQQAIRMKFLATVLTEVNPFTLCEKINRGEDDFLIVDVRSAEDYAQGHIKGAISIPATQIGSRYKEIPSDKEVILYCYDSECMLAPTSAYKLSSKGKFVKTLRCGYREWKERGLPTEVE